MKIKTPLLALIVGFGGLLALSGATTETVGGPKGGRLLESTPLPAEFLVTPDGKIEITFYDDARVPVAPVNQVVVVTAEPKSGRTQIELERTATGFLSKAPLPAADAPYRVVVQIRPNAGARPQNFRIDLNLEKCGGCQRSEYACICGH
jgi:hypothetical protein